MKKIILGVAFVMSLVGGQVFANNNDGISLLAKEAFEKDFPGIKSVKWEELKNHGIYVVRFVYDSRSLAVYYSEEGEMIASIRIMERQYLPLPVERTIKSRFDNADILKIEEMSISGSLSYFIVLETAKSRIQARINSDGSVRDIKKLKRQVNN